MEPSGGIRPVRRRRGDCAVRQFKSALASIGEDGGAIAATVHGVQHFRVTIGPVGRKRPSRAPSLQIEHGPVTEWLGGGEKRWVMIHTLNSTRVQFPSGPNGARFGKPFRVIQWTSESGRPTEFEQAGETAVHRF